MNISCGCAALSLVLGLSSAQADPPQFAPCQLTAPGTPFRTTARCSKLAVAENPSAPQNRVINLRIAVIPARSRQAQPDPIVLLAGGPGQAATEAYPPLAAAFYDLNRSHDILLVDQRGTGGSNALHCPEIDGAPTTPPSPTQQQRLTQACLQALPGDPRYYTTSQAVADLDQVRTALGYNQLNLLGISYGTRVALAYLRRYPDQVRSLVLDGIVPSELALGAEHALNAQQALELIIKQCRSEPACARRFPDPNDDFKVLHQTLAAESVEVNLADPQTSTQRTANFNDATLAGVVRLLSYAPETVALLPLLLDHARRSGDYSRLAAQSLLVTAHLDEQISHGMELSVICTEDVPFYTADAIATSRDTYLGARLIEAAKTQCAVWPRGKLPVDFKTPVLADTPALLLSGEWDPVTPPRYGERLHKRLRNSLHLVAPGQGHNVFPRGCLPRVVADFVAMASIKGLDHECIKELGPAAFFTSFTGPEP